jgi:hypothetical protein
MRTAWVCGCLCRRSGDGLFRVNLREDAGAKKICGGVDLAGLMFRWEDMEECFEEVKNEPGKDRPGAVNETKRE